METVRTDRTQNLINLANSSFCREVDRSIEVRDFGRHSGSAEHLSFDGVNEGTDFCSKVMGQ